jgi:hypothetical protein
VDRRTELRAPGATVWRFGAQDVLDSSRLKKLQPLRIGTPCGGEILDRRDYLKILCTPSPALCSSEHTYPSGDIVNIAMYAEGLDSNNPDSSDVFLLLGSLHLARSSTIIRTRAIP